MAVWMGQTLGRFSAFGQSAVGAVVAATMTYFNATHYDSTYWG